MGTSLLQLLYLVPFRITLLLYITVTGQRYMDLWCGQLIPFLYIHVHVFDTAYSFIYFFQFLYVLYLSVWLR